MIIIIIIIILECTFKISLYIYFKVITYQFALFQFRFNSFSLIHAILNDCGFAYSPMSTILYSSLSYKTLQFIFTVIKVTMMLSEVLFSQTLNT